MATKSSNKLQLFAHSKNLVTACYALTQHLPAGEVANLTYFVRSAALKSHLAVVQGVFTEKGKAKRKYLRQAKAQCTLIDAVVDVTMETGLLTEQQTAEVASLVAACYQQLKALKES